MNKTVKKVNPKEYTDENMKIKDFISRNQEQAQKNQTAVQAYQSHLSKLRRQRMSSYSRWVSYAGPNTLSQEKN